MKKRIKIDGTLMWLVVMFSGVLFYCSNLYPNNIVADNILDILGFFLILKGVLFRMSARGHKKEFSAESSLLVTTGPYSLTRNPMYLGSFMIGAGFLFIVWPWWTIVIFTVLFTQRFKIQIRKEEQFLEETFGQEYKDYCNRVNRIFPKIKQAMTVKTKEIFNFKDLFSTKDVHGLWGWLLFAVLLETIQEHFVYSNFDVINTIGIVLITALAFSIIMFIAYKIR